MNVFLSEPKVPSICGWDQDRFSFFLGRPFIVWWDVGDAPVSSRQYHQVVGRELLGLDSTQVFTVTLCQTLRMKPNPGTDPTT